jgi:hypothetical protein
LLTLKRVVVLGSVTLDTEARVGPIEVGAALCASCAATIAAADVDSGIEEGLGNAETTAPNVLTEPGVYLGLEG